jgi:hypothetical protein
MSWGETLSRASPQIVGARPGRARGCVLKSKILITGAVRLHTYTVNLWGRQAIIQQPLLNVS